jgi:hypothetical protein
MTDLRKAAEMALEALTRAHPISNSGKHLYAHSEAMAALIQALAEPANSTTDFVEPKTSSQTKQKPVDLARVGEVGVWGKWVGLTDEDLEPMCDDWRIIFGPYVHDFAKAIEAKLKEKNT